MANKKELPVRPEVPALFHTIGEAAPPMVYTPREAGTLLRLSKNTINAMLNSGRLRAVRCGRKWLIPRDALMAFLEAGEAS